MNSYKKIYHIDSLDEILQVKNCVCAIHPDIITREYLEQSEQYLIDNNIYLAVENVFTGEIKTLRQIEKLINNVKNVGMCFDLSHAFIDEQPMSDLEKYVDRVYLIHVNAVEGEKDRHLPINHPSAGIHWIEFSETLKKINFRGVILFEYYGDNKNLLEEDND